MNIDAINKTIAVITQAPAEKLLMSDYFTDSESKCNTAACIAGWTLLTQLSWEDIHKIRFKDLKAQAILEINATQAAALFFGKNTQEKYAKIHCLIYMRIKTPRINFLNILDLFDTLPATVRKQAAITVLVGLRDHGLVDWYTAIATAIEAHSNPLGTETDTP